MSTKEEWIVRSYLVSILVLLIGTAAALTRIDPGWGYGDWLINYEGGFVRRGLAGEVFLLAGKTLHVSPIYFVAFAGAACYTVLFICVWRLLQASSWRWWVIGLLVCPATLAFPVISRSSFRKEILYFALLATLVECLRGTELRLVRDPVLSALLGLACALLILSHEPAAAYLPYCAGALFIGLDSPRRVCWILVFPGLVCAVSMMFALSHQGDPTIVAAICDSLIRSGVRSCGFAVAALAETRLQAIEDVALFIHKYHYYRNYMVCIALAAVPFAGGVRDLLHHSGSRRSLRALGGAACVALALSVSLFRYGVDWGRWINIHLVSMLLLLLLIDDKRMSGSPTGALQMVRPTLPRRVAAALMLAYAVAWSLPGTKDKPLFGYLSLAYRVIHWNGSLTS